MKLKPSADSKEIVTETELKEWIFEFVLEKATEDQARKLFNSIIDFAENEKLKVGGGFQEDETFS